MFLQAFEVNANDLGVDTSELPKTGIVKIFCLAHEGFSKPRVGDEIRALRWSRLAIRRLTDRIKEGTKFFIGHKKANSDERREPVGEILKSFVKPIEGKLSSVIVGHFPNSRKINKMDVCSVEADVEIRDDSIDDIDDVSAVALGSSKKESPAFAGAKLLATVHCFTDIENDDSDDDEDEPQKKKKDDEMAKENITLDDIREGVKKLNVHPSQLYDTDMIKKDTEFADVFSNMDKLNKENEKLKKDLETTKKQTNVETAKSRMEPLLKDATDKQKTFILGRFNPENHNDLSDDGLKKYVDGAKKDFAEVSKLFGGEKSEQTEQTERNTQTTDNDDAKSLEDQALDIVLGRS